MQLKPATRECPNAIDTIIDPKHCVHFMQTCCVVRYPRYIDTYRRYLAYVTNDTGIAKVTVYRGSLYRSMQ